MDSIVYCSEEGQDMASKDIKESVWAETKRRCRLDEETVQMAKEMGLNPWSLIKNIPNKNEMWKVPVSEWIRDMYEARQEKAQRKKAAKDKQQHDINRT